MKRLTLVFPVLLGICLAPACSSTPDNDEECLDMSGTWTITEHCEPSFVGAVAVISQSGCHITNISTWQGWSGTVDPDGSFTISGYGGSEFITCTGTLTPTSAHVSCQPACNVSFTRGGQPLASGTRTCIDESTCQGLDCEHVTGANDGSCVQHCSQPSDCGPSYHCIVGDTIGLEASCFPDCSTAACAEGFTCLEYDTGLFGCLPTSWVAP